MQATQIGRKRLQGDDFAMAITTIAFQAWERGSTNEETINACVCYAGAILAADGNRSFEGTEEDLCRFVEAHYEELREAVTSALGRSMEKALACGAMPANLAIPN